MQAIYDSPYHNPGLFFLLGALFLVALARRLPFLHGYAVLFAFEILADALVTGGASPWKDTPWSGRLSLVFVLLGDYRFFLLLERYAKPGAPAFARAAGLTLIVPVLAQIARVVAPQTFAGGRVLFLSYELAMVVLLVALRLTYLKTRLLALGDRVRAWLLRVFLFELVGYAGWALCDVLILGGVDAGHALRILPNTMYYALFLPFVVLTAPDEATS